MTDARSLGGLNDPQRRAVEHAGGPLLVLAGAGSGKTRALTHRIAHLIEARGAAPGSVLAVTFTNKAAQEMRERIERLLGSEARGVWAGTFHSICLRILRIYGDRIRVPRSFTIYDESDRQSVLKRIVREAQLGEGGYEPRSLSASLSSLKNKGLDPRSPDAALEGAIGDRRLDILRAYQDALDEAGALDFDDLLLKGVTLLGEDPVLTERLRAGTCQHVLVDEFQDVNAVQYQFVRLLAGTGERLMAVGDEDQAIYGWRGADLGHLRRFETDFPGTTVVLLEQNYRSTGAILGAAHSIIAADGERREKRLWTDRGDGVPVQLHSARDDRSEARYVVGELLRLARTEGRRSGDFAIFYRTNAQSRVLEDELLHWNLPYVVVGGTRFYDRAEVKDALSYLRAMLHPREPVALRRILNRPARGIGATTLERVDQLAERERVPWTDALARATEHPDLTPAARNALRRFLEWLAAVRRETEGRGPVAVLDRLLGESRYLESLREDDSPDAAARLENLEELHRVAEEFEENYPGQDARAFLDEVSLVSDADQLGSAVERVSLMTLHTAKGLEFPVVFVVGLEEELVPHSRSRDLPKAVDEERRLLYVGMTRARERLTLVHAGERLQHGERRTTVPSRFLYELDPAIVTSSAEPGTMPFRPGQRRPVRGPGRVAEGVAPAFGAAAVAAAREIVLDRESSQEALRPLVPGSHVLPGLVVVHPTFGTGTVRRVEDRGERQKILVQFSRAGLKKLLVRLANLGTPG